LYWTVAQRDMYLCGSWYAPNLFLTRLNADKTQTTAIITILARSQRQALQSSRCWIW
jgi:hypothetical protein